MQGVMNYPAWKLIGPAEFPDFHQSIDGRILLFFVPVFFLSVLISVLMIWFGHPAISLKLRLFSALLTILIFIVTLGLAIPLQEKLALTHSTDLIDALIWYDRYLRTIPGLGVMALNFAMLRQLMKPERRIPVRE